MSHEPDNRTIAATLRELAELLERQGENAYKVQAYRRGASTIWELDRPAGELYRQGGMAALKRLPGIGDSLAQAVAEMLETGRLAALDTLRAEAPPEGPRDPGDPDDPDEEVPF